MCGFWYVADEHSPHLEIVLQPLRTLGIKGMELICADLAATFKARTSIPVICDTMDLYSIAQQVGDTSNQRDAGGLEQIMQFE